MFASNVPIKDGNFTKTIYTLIKDNQFNDAIRILHGIPESNSSRAGLSLLAYCYFYMQDFTNAANYYEQLIHAFPEIIEYKLYNAQALYQACMYDEAFKATLTIDHPDYKGQVTKLQAAIKYGEEDLLAARSLVDSCPADDVDTEINLGCLLYKEGRYEEALEKFATTLQATGFKPYLCYNVALCHYRLREYQGALTHISDVIQFGIRDHPELSVGSQTDGIDVRSVGNTLTLHETALTEAFNLKAALEYQFKNSLSKTFEAVNAPERPKFKLILLVFAVEGARDALTDMPPRAEYELDAVTLHNQALMNIDNNPTEGFEKLQFLLQQNPFPPETLSNLLLLYCKHDCFDLAADVLAENTHLTYKYLTPYLFDFLDAVITQQTSPHEAYQKLDDLANKHTELLKKLTKQVQENRSHRYIPVLMAQAKIHWDLENYEQVEKIFRKSVEFCNENDTWKLNVAHVLFMQENKFKEATGFYEPIVRKHFDDILKVSAMVLANLCVSYIMTSQNEEAEELMRKIEKEEDQVSFEEPDKKLYHLCIVNLVIGTLYCAKSNYEFGISRIMKSLEPYNKKLGSDTWFHTKRCFLSLLENLAKHQIVLRDSVIQECINFLENCEAHGKNIKSFLDGGLAEDNSLTGKKTVAYEARLLKSFFLKLQNF